MPITLDGSFARRTPRQVCLGVLVICITRLMLHIVPKG